MTEIKFVLEDSGGRRLPVQFETAVAAEESRARIHSRQPERDWQVVALFFVPTEGSR